MFLGTKELKARMNEAFKLGGLTVGNKIMPINSDGTLQSCYIIKGNRWQLQINGKFLPNEIKGLIVSLVGRLPIDEVMEAKKGEPEQSAMWFPEDELINEVEDIDKGEGYIEITRLLVLSAGALNAIVQTGGKKVCINMKYVTMIKPQEVDIENGESAEDGPYYKDGKVYWFNNTSIFVVETSTMNDADHELLKKLEGVRI